jgi:uncharacterized ion transporter superfamily protein YfcC
LKARKFPHSLLLVSIVLVLLVVLTWVIPAGKYDTEIINVGGITKTVVIPDSYREVESNYQGLELFLAPLEGFVSAADIIAFVFLVGGAFSIINRTGAINAGLYKVIEMTKRKEALRHFVIPLLMLLFSIGGATFGMAEEVLVFLMVTIPLAIALGYDSIVGIAIPFIGAGVGFAGAFMNPFTVGIAQGIAGIDPLFSGMIYRLIVWFLMTVIAIVFVYRYAEKVRKDPKKSVIGKIDYGDRLKGLSYDEMIFNTKRKIIIIGLVISLGILIYGVTVFSWYIAEISGLFIGLGLFSAIIYRLNPDEIINSFIDGAKDMIVPAVLIGLAKGALIIAENGMIIDTMLYNIANVAEGLPNVISVEIMFLIQSALNFIVPSGSGQAALTMPILAPLSDVLGISRQTSVLAYQFGDGITNFIIPTSGVTMGILEIAKVPYNTWLKWILPLMIILFLFAFIMLAIATSFDVWSL